MASNDTTASGDVLFQDGDDLSETNIAETAAKSNQTDYVERGLGFSNISSGSVTVGSGHAVIEDGNKAYDIFPDQTDVSLPESNGVNHIYLVHDPSVDNDITFHADTDDTGPSNPSLKIGTVDTSDNSSTTTNRAPDGDYESLSADQADITNETFVRGELSSTKTGVSGFTNALDSTSEDSRGEFSSNQFTPDESGEYHIIGTVELDSVASGDLCRARFRNVTDGSEPSGFDRIRHRPASTQDTIPILRTPTLTAGKAYELQVEDFDQGSFDIGIRTQVVITRSVVHP